MWVCEKISPSMSQDKNVRTDEYGKEILDMCKNCNIRILNGRMIEDMRGQFTCVTRNGCSVVDYAICSTGLIKNVSYFQVNELLQGLSDHCKIEMFINSKFNVGCNEEIQLFQLPTKVKWNAVKREIYLENLNNDNTKNKIEECQKQIKDEQFSVGQNLNGLNDIFTSSLLSTFGKCNRQKNKRKKINKRWYDKDCDNLRDILTL